MCGRGRYCEAKAKLCVLERQIIDDIRYEITREEILKEIKPLDTSVLEKIGPFAYFEEFISDNLLEKAWKMPWGWGKKEDFKPILVILDGNSRIERDREVTEEILEFHCWNLRNKTYCPKDRRDFK
jgi:hypothetical protein